jgi:hypothetical protein
MSALQAIADRVKTEALRGEAAGSAMLGYDGGAAQFPPDGTLRNPNVCARLTGRKAIRAGSAPPAAANAGHPPTGNKSSAEG